MVAVPLKTTAMKPLDPYAGTNKTKDGVPQFNPTVGATTRSPNMPSKGSDPKASMIDGPYGGKKPQS